MKMCAACGCSLLFVARVASASEFAEPPPRFAEPARHAVAPDREPVVEPEPEAPRTEGARNAAPGSARVAIGPLVRIAAPGADGGLFVALDFGGRYSGLRTSALWARSGAKGGLSQYGLDLWIDLGGSLALRPVLAAGAALARVGGNDGVTRTLAAGTLRATLEYQLPLAGVDARAGVDVLGNMPAAGSKQALETQPYLLLDARVGVAF